MASVFFLRPLNLKFSTKRGNFLYPFLTCPISRVNIRHAVLAKANGSSSEGPIPFGRFSEFTSSSEGNAYVQDDIVREVLRRATHLSTSESMDSTIQTHLGAVSDYLSDMYSKTERDIEERNQKIAIQTSLPEISKWNKQLIDGNKASRQHRLQISKELALVDALLKRTSRSQRKLSRHPSTTHHRMNLRQNMYTTSLNDSLKISRGRKSTGTIAVSASNAFAFTLSVCIIALESFDSVVSRQGGAARLANYAAFTTFLILSISYINALRISIRRAQDDLHRQAGSLEPTSSSDRT